MTEGELKNRINSAEVKYIDEVFHPYTIVNIKDVKAILDEAKNEMYSEWERRPELTGEMNEWKRLKLATWNLRFGALLEKWFGEQP